MTRYVLVRLLWSLGVALGVTTLVFAILQAIPGDPAQALVLGQGATPEQVAALRSQLGLDQPVIEQYLQYIGNLLHGDIGYSFLTRESVASALAARLPSTLQLAVSSMAFGLLFGGTLGALAAMRPNTWLDRLLTGSAVVGGAIPYFWLAMLLVLGFSVNLQWFPAVASGSPLDLVLPTIALGTIVAASVARLLRNSLLQVYEAPYILAARSRGFASKRLLLRHALRNALGPVVTVLGLQFGAMLTGAVAIEFIFGRNGVGSYLFVSMQSKDIPAIQGTVIIVALMYVATNLVVDIARGWLDPRVRAQWAKQ